MSVITRTKFCSHGLLIHTKIKNGFEINHSKIKGTLFGVYIIDEDEELIFDE